MSSLKSHIEWIFAQKKVIKGKEFVGVNFEQITPLVQWMNIKNYCFKKWTKLDLTDYDICYIFKDENKRYHNILNDVLDSPIHAARKLLYWRGFNVASLSKRRVFGLYLSVFDDNSCELLREIFLLYQKYLDHSNHYNILEIKN